MSNELLPIAESIATRCGDYRMPPGRTMDTDHVLAWIERFPGEVRPDLLRAVDRALDVLYVPRSVMDDFLDALLGSAKLAGDDPATFWRGASFLSIQQAGGSQREMLEILSRRMEATLGFSVAETGIGEPHSYVYLDDGVFTGNRVRRDLEVWLANGAPEKLRLHIVAMAFHRGGQWYADQRIREQAKELGKELEITWWRSMEIEDRKAYLTSSDVLRPTAIPDDAAVQAYVEAMTYKPALRKPGGVGGLGVFEDEPSRHLLEQELLKAGAAIRGMCPGLGETQRPLGHSTLETLGFGTFLITFRNCPNNAPLALWVDDPWYALFPRRSNSQTELERFIRLLGG